MQPLHLVTSINISSANSSAVAEPKKTAGSMPCFVTPRLGNAFCETELLLDLRKQEPTVARCDSQPSVCTNPNSHTSQIFYEVLIQGPLMSIVLLQVWDL